jgi:MtN3 and saliva related transmembrane protein
MYTLQIIGVFLWLLYDIVINDMALICANGVTFVLSLIILVHQIIFK